MSSTPATDASTSVSTIDVPQDTARLLTDVAMLLEDSFDALRQVLDTAAVGVPHADGAEPLTIDLVEQLRALAARPGKRIRPIAAAWGWAAAGGPPTGTRDDLVRVGAALELLHLFALIQDDVMDRSEQRRGRPTIHTVQAARHASRRGLGDPELFGDSVAYLLSDLALSEATLLVAPTAPAVRDTWRAMAAELVAGQLLDVTHTAGRRRVLAASRRIARFKSARYTMTRPIELGAQIAQADAETVRQLSRWGDLVGDAFAIRDDILGVWGDPADTGKPAGDDLSSGKPTVLLSWAVELLPAEHAALLDRCDSGSLDAEAVEVLRDAMDQAGVRRMAEDTIDDLVSRADDLLAQTARTEPAMTPAVVAGMRQLAHAVAWRHR